MAITTSKTQSRSSRGVFWREFQDNAALQSTALFDVLKKDVESGDIFPAVRNGYLDFYRFFICIIRVKV